MPDEPKELTDPLEPTDEGVEEEEEEDDDQIDAAAVDDGEICAICGLDFKDQQQGPSLCPSCWKTGSEQDRKDYAESTSDVVHD